MSEKKLIRIEEYKTKFKESWNEFVRSSKNGYFMFEREFMEYHSDRFVDNSLMFFDDDDLIALMPANIKDDVLYSHQGLSFGGIVSDSKMKTVKMLEIFVELKNYCKAQGIKKIIYKAIPYIYHQIPADEDSFGLYKNNAKLVKCEVSSTIYLDNKLKLSKGKKCGISKAKKANLEIRETKDFESFLEIEKKALKKHNAKPVHTYKEMLFLQSLFPENIKLYGVYNPDNNLIAGTILFKTENLVHTQYIAANQEGFENGAIDYLINHLIYDKYSSLKYFDFGISTEDGGNYLNEGLVLQKEMFGARTVLFKTYELDIK